MLLLRPCLASIMARHRVVVVRGGKECRELVRPRSTKASGTSTNPERPVSSATMAAASVTIAAGCGGAAYYFYYANVRTNDQDEDLARRHQIYQNSSRHRLRLAACVVSPANRTKITERVNQLINVPGIGEPTEAILIRKAVDQYMDALEQILVGDHDLTPSATKESNNGANSNDDEDDNDDFVREAAWELTQATRHHDTEGMDPKQLEERAKEDLVRRLNAKVDIYGLSEAQEAILIRGVVNQLFLLFPGIQKLL